METEGALGEDMPETELIRAVAVETSVLPGLPLLGASGSVVVTLLVWSVFPAGGLMLAPPPMLGALLP